MSSFTTVLTSLDLPPLVLLQTAALLITGARDLFAQPPTTTTTTSAKPQQQQQDNGMRGILTLALGLAQLWTGLHYPIAQNQLIHASVPIRVFVLVPLGLLRFGLYGSRIQGQGKADLMAAVVVDLFGGLLVGWSIGNYSGRV
ncbi:uncharacterized protein B0I36DRAFT_358702 [Microdochium trichocladiopsis]|uniref:Uncharacterized protein n=1 Tax=Microdochium trichocladiopsis TaxID=1682393 RepID=A0A9P8YK74_9PEZI|nr:uncharacterized protein B0I36DRAFT_358702 [Microdochium trichocladiopsis]KAH7041543.1 hypothetical protein B0I36DRAFT_358702 [Microdochium trichocladiopsis]